MVIPFLFFLFFSFLSFFLVFPPCTFIIYLPSLISIVFRYCIVCVDWLVCYGVRWIGNGVQLGLVGFKVALGRNP